MIFKKTVYLQTFYWKTFEGSDLEQINLCAIAYSILLFYHTKIEIRGRSPFVLKIPPYGDTCLRSYIAG